jgi:hypothetical protein
MRMEKTHGLHPARDPAVSAQDTTQGGKLSCAWENEMKRAEMIIERVTENLSMFVRIDTRDVDDLHH